MQAPLCSAKTKWTSPPFGGPSQNQQSHHTRLRKQQPHSQHFVGRSTAHGWVEVFLQTRLLPSIPLFADGRLPVNSDAGI